MHRTRNGVFGVVETKNGNPRRQQVIETNTADILPRCGLNRIFRRRFCKTIGASFSAFVRRSTKQLPEDIASESERGH